MRHSISVLVLLAAILPAMVGADEAKTPDGTKEAPHVTTAVKMLEEWKDNEVRAEAKYKGKWVIISGQVREVKKSFGKPLVILEGLSGFSGVQIVFPKSESEGAASLDKGVETSILARVKGKSLGYIMAEDGSLAKQPATTEK